MKILLIRHARAEPRSRRKDDSTRALTRRGTQRQIECASGLRELGRAPGLVLHSPWLRAAQTAALLAHAGEPVEAHAGLARAPDERLCEELAARGADELWCVGHEPWLSELACLLCGLPRERAAVLELKKSGVLWLEGDGRTGEFAIRALLGPRLLRRVLPAG
jgi:phosphohistidine phosphatase